MATQPTSAKDSQLHSSSKKEENASPMQSFAGQADPEPTLEEKNLNGNWRDEMKAEKKQKKKKNRKKNKKEGGEGSRSGSRQHRGQQPESAFDKT